MNLKEQVWEKYEHTGFTDKEIAESVGCSKSYVRLVTAGAKKKHLTKAEEVRIAYLWGADIGIVEIAAEMKTGPLRIERLLRKYRLL
jgi:hypothetical protein